MNEDTKQTEEMLEDIEEQYEIIHRSLENIMFHKQFIMSNAPESIRPSISLTLDTHLSGLLFCITAAQAYAVNKLLSGLQKEDKGNGEDNGKV